MANKLVNLVFIPAFDAGHITPALEFAKLLVNRDQNLAITILILEPRSLNPSSMKTTCVKSFPKDTNNRICIIKIIPPVGDSQPSNINEFISSHCKNVKGILSIMINGAGSSFGPVAGLVIDMHCTCMIDVANEFNIPTYVFFTSNAAYLGFKLYIQTLNDDQNQDVKKLRHSDTEIQVPGFVKKVPTKVFPTMIDNKERLEFLLMNARRLKDVKAIMVNTYSELETHAIESLTVDKTVPPVYPVGPILNLENHVINDDIITWLDSQPPSSVVFLCFGSMGSFDEVQVKEIARGLEQSGYPFVWSLRRPPSNQASKGPSNYKDPSVVLPEGFLERTAEQGKVIGWAPQVTLLGHQAVGGFVSHCGWNSLLESLWFGVPSATWPIYAEQQINAFDMVEELGLAVEIKLDYVQYLVSTNADKKHAVLKDKRNKKNADKKHKVIVTAEEIESGIRRLMEDNKIRTKVKEMSAKSRAAVKKGGSSYMAIGSLIQDFVKNLS